MKRINKMCDVKWQSFSDAMYEGIIKELKDIIKEQKEIIKSLKPRLKTRYDLDMIQDHSWIGDEND